ncbi:MAG TPA: substrate-binding domain-containing protein [Solirubrobacteraceae bacterium]|nr:substrate-binding domain-containing protein [Solirubrobacteraceae bacterium]
MFRSAKPAHLRVFAVLLVLSLTAGLATTAWGGSDKPAAKQAASKKKVKIAMELILTGVQFGVDTKNGINAFVKDDGAVSAQVNGPVTVDPGTAQKQTTDMIAKGPNAVGVAPFPPEAWQRTLKDINKKYPKTSLTFNAKPSGKVGDISKQPFKTFVGINDAASARAVLTKTIELAKLKSSATGEVLLGQCVPGNTGVLADRIRGFKQVLAKLLPKATPVVFDSKVDPQGNTTAWTTELVAHPKPILAIGTCDQDGTSLYKVKKANSSYKFPVGAVETPPETVLGIQDGTILASSSVNWYLEGYTAARLLAESARGKAIPAGFIDIGYTMITKKNIAEIKKRNSSLANTRAWYAPKVKEQFANMKKYTHSLSSAWK